MAVGVDIANGASDQGDDLTISCGGGGGEDLTAEWTAPSSADYSVHLTGSDYDTALAVYDACDGTEQLCNDDAFAAFAESVVSAVNLCDVTAGDSFIFVVDGYNDGVIGGATGNYVVNIVERVPDTDCCTDNGGLGVTGCEDASIETCVCDNDPYCCESEWDGVCVAKAEFCGADCGSCPGVPL
jgi:hypothetical protein